MVPILCRVPFARLLGSLPARVIGLSLGGYTGSADTNSISYHDTTATTGNAASKGALTVARRGASGQAWSSIYGFPCGGNAGGTLYSIIEYVDHTTTSGGATNRGAISSGSRTYLAMGHGTVYGFIYDGSADATMGTVRNYFDWINLTTATANSSSKGTDILGRAGLAAVSRPATYNWLCGGQYPSNNYVNTISYVDATTTSGGATDGGDLTGASTGTGAVWSDTYGFVSRWIPSTSSTNWLDLTTASTNGTNKGGLSVNRAWCAGNSGSVYGYFLGGLYNVITLYNVIDRIDLTTTVQTAADKGDLLSNLGFPGGM